MQLAPGQVAVVTGAAHGIGRALTEALVGRGLRVVMADVQAEALAAAAQELTQQRGEVLAAPTDVSDPDAVEALAAKTLSAFGRVDVVCNNAGVVPPMAPSWEQDPVAWRWLVDVKLLGVAYGIRSFVPHLVEQGRGHVLNTASMAGVIPLPMLAPYSAVMHAVVGMTETLDAEFQALAPGVGATVLCPGRVPTSLGETSALNRPASLVVPPPRPAESPDVAEAQVGSTGHVMSAPEVAELAVAGIEQGRLHVITHRGSGRPIRARVESVLADLPVPPPPL